MKTCLVSLVSDQTIPNILVALHFHFDFLLLLSTTEMEEKGKSQAILDTLKLRGRNYDDAHHILKVEPDSIINLQTEVTRWIDNTPDDFHFIVNLTGGTKLMSIAAFTLFTDYDNTMVYVPIPRNEYLIPFPKRRPKAPVPLDSRLSVKEYLTAYNVEITNQRHLEDAKNLALYRHELTRFIYQHYQEVQPLLEWFGDHLRPLKPRKVKKGYDFAEDCNFGMENEAQKYILDKMGFGYENGSIRKVINESDWNYLRGGWLEERIFLAIQAALPRLTDVQLGIKIKDQRGNENELDVVFTRDNTLYLVECKSPGAAEGEERGAAGTIIAFLYKQGALRQQFGLTPKVFLATTTDTIYEADGQVKAHLLDRARQFQGEIIPLLNVLNLEAYFEE